MESVLTYGVALAAGMVSGIILAKFLFLVLLRMTGLPVNLEFVFEPGAFRETAITPNSHLPNSSMAHA